MEKQYILVVAKNARKGVTKTGKPYINVGLVIKDGDKRGSWLNYFKIVTDKTRPYIKQDLEIMGITDLDDFTCDGRLFNAVWGWDSFFKEERVLGVSASKFQPDRTKNEGTSDGGGEVF